MLAVDQSLIGKEACELVKSVITGKPFCKTRRITGYLVEQDRENGGIKVSIRFHDGAWVDATHVFMPKDYEEEYKKFVAKYGDGEK